MKKCFVAAILIAGCLSLFTAASAKTMAEKWRDKRLPAIFAAWSIGPNHYFSYQNAADYAIAAKHGLFYTNLDNIGFVFNTQYQGEGEVLTDASKVAAKSTVDKLVAINPNIIVCAEIPWYDYANDWLPAGHQWWAGGSAWPGRTLVKSSDPAFQDHVAKQAAAAMNSGAGLDGVMLDWGCSGAIVQKVRAAIGPAALIIVNTNGGYHSQDQLVNAIDAEGAGVDDRNSMLVVERWEKNALFPGIWCAENFGPDDPTHAKQGAAAMTTFTNGFYLLAGSTNGHFHPWYPAWDIDLGKAMAPPLGLGENIWMRQCEKGVSMYHRNDSTAMIQFDAPYVKTSDMTQGTSFRSSGYEFYTRTGTPALAPGPETIYEAEAAGNTRTGSTAISTSYVTNIGGGASNGLTFTNVTAATAGAYIMKMTYVAAGIDQIFKVRVNTQKALRFFCRNSGTVSSPATECYLVRLNAGANEIKFYNDQSTAPDLDKITIAYCGYLAMWAIPYSNVASDLTPPSTPTNVQATPVSEHKINLAWTAASDAESGIIGYLVYRGTQKVGEATGTSFSDIGLSESTQYSYKVSAINGAGLEGLQSDTATATTPADHAGPIISLVSATLRTRVTVVFDEPVEQSSAENSGNYIIAPTIPVTAASLGADLKTVSLTVGQLSAGIGYMLTINNVRDRATAPNAIAANSKAPFQYQGGITRIRFFPRSGLSARMVGGVFEATNGSATAGPYTTLYTITTTPGDNQWTEIIPSGSDIAYRYARYRAGGACNVAEIEFYRGTEKATGVSFGTPGSWGNSGNDYTKAFDGNTATFFDYSQDVGGYTGLDFEAGGTVDMTAPPCTPAIDRAALVAGAGFIELPAGPYDLRVVNVAGMTLLHETGVGPRNRDISSVGSGMHVIAVTSAARTMVTKILRAR